jgi:hypothetical protein
LNAPELPHCVSFANLIK